MPLYNVVVEVMVLGTGKVKPIERLVDAGNATDAVKVALTDLVTVEVMSVVKVMPRVDPLPPDEVEVGSVIASTPEPEVTR